MKTIWIWNHYAGSTFFEQGGRHYNFAKYLIKRGYNVKIFSANVIHNSEKFIDTKEKLRVENIIDNIPYVFIKTRRYSGNGIRRIMNMIDFYVNLFKVSSSLCRDGDRPDIIFASSVHPLTLVAGIKVAKKMKIPCICEVRDLWPESIVAYGKLKANSLITKILRVGEKWIYEKANALVFTMEGGKDYIIEQKWDIQSGGNVNLDKVYYINNGVDLEQFDYNVRNNSNSMEQLNVSKIFKVIYTGSIRMVNQVELLVDTGKALKQKGVDNVKIYIFGDGTERKRLEARLIDENIDNIEFMGKVFKNQIPWIISKADLNVIVGEHNELYRFGISPNKLFEYLAAGKPILSTIKCKYDIIKSERCGIRVDVVSAENIAAAIETFQSMREHELDLYCKNARKTAEEYDFKSLTKKLEDIVARCIQIS